MSKTPVKKSAGKRVKTIGINVSLETAQELKHRAQSMHLSESRYCRLVLKEWIESGRQLVLEE
jgi:hypothetical protein